MISIIGFLAGADAKTDADRASFLNILHSGSIVRGVLIGSRRQMKEMCQSIQANKIKPIVDKQIFGWEDLKEAYQYQWEQKHFGEFWSSCLLPILLS